MTRDDKGYHNFEIADKGLRENFNKVFNAIRENIKDEFIQYDVLEALKSLKTEGYDNGSSWRDIRLIDSYSLMERPDPDNSICIICDNNGNLNFAKLDYDDEHNKYRWRWEDKYISFAEAPMYMELDQTPNEASYRYKGTPSDIIEGELKEYEIWVESFYDPSKMLEPEEAKLIGTCEGNSFYEACREYMDKYTFYDEVNNTYLGRKLHDNKNDAQLNYDDDWYYENWIE